MRGKVCDRVEIPVDFRITPAYAGKSRQQERLLGVRADHPRLCGEKTLEYAQKKLNKGSPPPMRGKVCFV